MNADNKDDIAQQLTEKRRLDILFNSIQGGIITLDKDFIITSVNKYIEEWVSMSGDELTGKNSIDVFHDKIGICPHCAAKHTFETGESNSIMQSRGINYAELTAYPINNEARETVECVVFIIDITERVLYQEETLSLYREVIQTKEYMESIIDNSADAIVTTDLEGIITSWNEGAEKIFGFTETEAIGKLHPFVPDFLMDRERESLEKIKKGEVIKDIETLRRKKDGAIIEVSLTLSPIKDASGEVIGISGISRDISEKKSVEKELIRRNQELSRLFFISSAMRGTLELDKLLRMVLVAVTVPDGMGFNRAILLLVDEDSRTLKGALGAGPASPVEFQPMSDELWHQRKPLQDVIQDVLDSPLSKESFLDRLALSIEIPLDKNTVLANSVRDKKAFNILNVDDEPLTDTILLQQLETNAYAVVPLIARDRVIGVILVDNHFSKRPINPEDIDFLTTFSNHMAAAIETARLFEQVVMAEQQLENIFESMTDMVYLTDHDCVIRNLNNAACNKVGLSVSQIIGKKCYQVFHGMDCLDDQCPHRLTLETKKAYIEEFENAYLGGTYLASSSPMFDSHGKYTGTVHVVRDTTEFKKLRENLIKAERELAFRAAHKLGNPLYAVETELLTLRKRLEKGNYQVSEIIDAMNISIEKGKKIIEELKTLTRAETISIQTTDILPVIRHSLRLAQQQSVKVEIECAESVLNVLSDPVGMSECFDELIANALKWLDKSDKKLSVDIGRVDAANIPLQLNRTNQYVRILVTDNGPGIPNDKKDLIFNPFFTTDKDGSGLGLSVVKRIIDASNGLIREIGSFGEGAIFEIYIPLAPSEGGL